MADTWFNSDGLLLKFGPTRAVPNVGGEYKTYGELHFIEVTLDLTTLASTPIILSDVTAFPKNARFDHVDLITQTAATSSGSATLDIGLQKYDRSTEIDYDGIVAALAKTAYDAAGKTSSIFVGSTGAGALLGTTTSNPGFITANYKTAAFTAGVLRVRIYYYIP